MESIGFSIYTIISYVNSDNFTSSFPIWLPFISFSSLITVAGTSNTMLDRSGDSGHTCLVSYLRGKVLSFYPLSMILVVGVSYMVFIMLRYAPSVPNLLSAFVINGCCTFSNAFLHLLI